MKEFIKKIIEVTVDKFSQHQKYFFPKTFIWKWKLEYLLQKYESETTLFFKKNIKPGMIVVDIGANIGYFTRIFAKLVGEEGKIYAFEPDKENFELLKKNTSHLLNVEVINAAVSELTGTINFYHIVGATGTHSLISSSDAEVRSVPCYSLDEFFLNRKAPDFLKIDVEGAEAQVFKGMEEVLDKNKITVVFEYQPSVNAGLIEDLDQKHTLYSISKNGTLQDFKKIKYRVGKVPYANVCIVNRV